MKWFWTLIIAYTVYSFPARAALNDGQCADSVIAQIQTFNSYVVPARMKPWWTAICKGLLDHLKAQMEINLQSGDVQVPGASGLISTNPGQPVGGIGLNSPLLIPAGRIQ